MTTRLKTLATLITSCDADGIRPFVALEHIESGTGNLFAEPELSELTRPDSGAAAVEVGDVLFGKLRPYLAKSWLVDRPAFASTELLCLRPAAGVEPRWLAYICASQPLIRWAVATSDGTKMPRTSWEKLSQYRPTCPPLVAQRRIADYLDTETARIDALLSTKQRMIELFRARTDALVENETGNLRGQCNAVPLKRLVREIDQRLGERTPPEMLSVSIHYGVLPRSQVTDKLPRAEELSAYKMCDRDDIVLNRMRAFQGGVGRSPQAGIVSPDYTVLRPCNLVLSRYLHYVFRSPWFVGEMTARLRGIGDSEQGNVRTPRINVAELGLIKVPLPSVTSQAQLVDKIDGKVAQMRTIIEKLSHQIDLLREHRQALITAAVTGELEIPVPEAVA